MIHIPRRLTHKFEQINQSVLVEAMHNGLEIGDYLPGLNNGGLVLVIGSASKSSEISLL